ncbi:MAG: hypothetical protein WCG63_02525 [Opitutaceae bacterium]
MTQPSPLHVLSAFAISASIIFAPANITANPARAAPDALAEGSISVQPLSHTSHRNVDLGFNLSVRFKSSADFALRYFSFLKFKNIYLTMIKVNIVPIGSSIAHHSLNGTHYTQSGAA